MNFLKKAFLTAATGVVLSGCYTGRHNHQLKHVPYKIYKSNPHKIYDYHRPNVPARPYHYPVPMRPRNV